MKHNRLFIRLVLLLILYAFGTLLSAQEFDIRAFADSTKYGWNDIQDRMAYRQDLLNRQNKLQLYEMETVGFTSNLLKSAVLPGWGQFSTKQNTKASIILGAEILSLVSAYHFYNQAQRNYDLYMKADQVDEINELWDNTSKPYSYSLMMASLAGVIWAYNVFDVIISTNEYNRQLWEDIMKKESQSPLTVSPAGVSVRF